MLINTSDSNIGGDRFLSQIPLEIAGTVTTLTRLDVSDLVPLA